MKGFMKNNKFHPIRNKRTVSKTRRAKDSKGLSTSLGAIISPPKKATKILIKQLTDDLDFRDRLIGENTKLKEEIKADPQGEFAKGSREEFKENAKEIKNLGNDAKRAFRDLPKESKEILDRSLMNGLRVLRLQGAKRKIKNPIQ